MAVVQIIVVFAVFTPHNKPLFRIFGETWCFSMATVWRRWILK